MRSKKCVRFFFLPTCIWKLERSIGTPPPPHNPIPSSCLSHCVQPTKRALESKQRG